MVRTHHQNITAEAQNQKVSLGCGTLILIAIIVLIFGNSGSNRELDQKIRQDR